MPKSTSSTFSKRFCWRQLTTQEWKLIVEKAYLIGAIDEVNFRDPDTWLRIVNSSKVS